MAEQASAQFYLASASPRRSELLRQLGYRFIVHPVDIDETRRAGETAQDFVCRLAEQKAATAFQQLGKPVLPVLGADTVVVQEERIMGKPADKSSACEMWTILSGREHRVLTAVSVVNRERQATCLNETKVRFRPLSREDMDNYWASGEPKDKAGAYGIQGLGSVFVESIQGSYSAVVGLPLFETAQLLGEFGIPVW